MVRVGRSCPVSRLLLAILAAACLACEPSAGRTFESGVEHLPGPGSFHVEGDPATAERALSVRFYASGDASSISTVSNDFAAGDHVRFEGTTFPGEQGMIVNGVRCAGRFPVENERETDVILRITDEGCETTVVRIHDYAKVETEAMSAHIFGTALARATIDFVSLDDPPRRAPMMMTADESGWFVIVGLPPGRYRLDVRGDSAGRAGATVDIQEGDSLHVDLTRQVSPDPS